MPFSPGSAPNEESRLLDLINANLSGLAVNNDPSAISNGWRTIAVDNLAITGVTAPTTAILTSTSMSVKGASVVTVLYDITGATTGVVVTVLGGISGFGMYTVRSVTAVAGLQGFIVGDINTGATSETNHMGRIDDISIMLQLAANTGGGTGVALVTMRTRFLTQP